MISVLEGCDEYPLRTRNKIDELVDNFIDELGDDIHDMICDNNITTREHYRGLDSDRGTEAEVENCYSILPLRPFKNKI
ncbi:MAG: hypothetical protein ACI8RD_001886 [Bacillariaceae sp.]